MKGGIQKNPQLFITIQEIVAMPKCKKNHIGLTLLEYQLAFCGWKVSQSWLQSAFNAGMRLQDAKILFAEQKGTRQIEAKRTRRLSLQIVKKAFQRVNEQHARRVALKALMPDARAWLEQTFPDVLALSRHRVEQEMAGTVAFGTEVASGAAPNEAIGVVELGRPEGYPVDITGGQPMPLVDLFAREA